MKLTMKQNVMSLIIMMVLMCVFCSPVQASAIYSGANVTDFNVTESSDGYIEIDGTMDVPTTIEYSYFTMYIWDSENDDFMHFLAPVNDDGSFYWKFENPFPEKSIRFDLDQCVCKIENGMSQTAIGDIQWYGQSENHIYNMKYTTKNIDTFLGPTIEAPLNTPLVLEAMEEIDKDTSNKPIGEKIYLYLIKHVKASSTETYIMNNEMWRFDRSPEYVLDSGTTNCGGFANCYVAIARSYGIPAKVVIGTLEIPGFQKKGQHGWNEIYDSKTKKWIVVDCCNIYNGYGLSYSPASYYGDSDYKIQYDICYKY